jgi:nucleoside phosphorylase
MPCAVILTAIPIEYEAVRSHLTDLQEEVNPQETIYERGKFTDKGKEWEVGIVEVGAGNVNAAVEANRAIAYFKPDVLFFVGIAGGIKDVEIGDIVAATKVYSYESGKVGDQFFTRPSLGQSSYELVQRAKAEARKEDWLRRLSSSPASPPHVLVAPIAAGEKVVASRQSDTFRLMRTSYNDAIAVEMEGFGFLEAAFAHPNIKTMVIRGISDLVEGKNDNDLEPEQVRQKKASLHASAFTFEMLAKLPIHTDALSSQPSTSRETVGERALREQSTQLKTLIVSTQEGQTQLSKLIVDQGEKTVTLVADRVQKDISQITSAFRKYPEELVDNEIKKHLSILRRARFFSGFSVSDSSIRLAEKMLNGEFEGGSDDVKSSALAWCARFLAYSEQSAQADECLRRARQFGNGPEITVAEAFRISANGNVAEALGKLADVKSPHVRTAAFFIVSHHQDAASAIAWLARSGITYTDLDPDGKFFLLMKLFDLSQWEKALEYVNALREEDYQYTPALFHAAAMTHLAQAIPDELKSFILRQLPFEAHTFPLASTEASLRSRRKSQALFHECARATRELGCLEVATLAEDYALWLELRDPEGQVSGRQKLEASMREPSTALRRLHLALQFGVKPNLNAVEQEIERQTTISGGKSHVAAMARFALAFTQESPKAVADYIERHRAQLQEHLEKKSISTFEIEMLARAGLPQQAEERLKDLINDGLSEVEQNYFRRIIAESMGVNPIEARKVQFEKSGQLNDLVNLANLLEEQDDWSQLCHYGSLLLERTQSVSDAERLARALHERARYSDLAVMLRKYPEFLSQSDNLQMFWSWALYREGSLAESKAALEKLRPKRDPPIDRALAVNLAITSGAWETLLPFVEREWANREKRAADDLIQIAQLAQEIGSSRAKDLVYAAASKGNNNAGILAAAYFLAVRGGWEDEEAVAQWLQNAAELSDSTGPLQRKSLKDLVDQAPEWHRRETDTWRQVNDGTLPLFGAAHLLNKSLIDLFLLPALANPSEADPRRRALVPAYSGVRQLLPCSYRVVAMDATTLLTLGALGLLETASNMFEQVVIPHSTLGWLFEEQQKVSFHQPSRMKDAVELRDLLAIDALKEFSASTVPDADLASEVGEELASLITEARAKDSGQEQQKIVVRSFPVHRVSSLMEEEADLSPHYSYLCSCLAVVNKLKQRGQLTTTEERRAKSYLSLHERDWPHQPEIADGAALYLDDLSVSYLQHIGLLEKLRPAGLETYVSTRRREEVNALLRYGKLSSKVNEIIEAIRTFLAEGIQAEKIKVGPMPNLDQEKETALRHHPTFAVFDLAKDVEAIVVDDRFLNPHANVDIGSSRTPMLTSLDLLQALYASGNITFDQMLDYRTGLRRASYLFVPVTNDELEHYLSHAEVVAGCLVETAELKAIRENLLRIRMSPFLQLPKEAPWLDGLMQTFINVLKAQWRSEIDETVSVARSEWLLELLDLRGWAHCLSGEGGLRIATYGYGAQITTLLSAPVNIPPSTRTQYWKWVDKRVLTTISQEEPEIYSWLIEWTKELIIRTVEDDPSKEAFQQQVSENLR